MTDVIYPDNPLTRAIETMSQLNREGGGGASFSSVDPPPTVRSASLGRETPIVPSAPPLTPEEQAEFDAAAAALGITDGGGEAAPPPEYPTLEAAMAAGAPVRPPAGAPVQAHQTAREFLAQRRVGGGQLMAPGLLPRLPNFSNVEGIDLLHGNIVIDGLVFPMQTVDAEKLRAFAIKEARRQVNRAFAEATGTQPKKRRRRKKGV